MLRVLIASLIRDVTEVGLEDLTSSQPEDCIDSPHQSDAVDQLVQEGAEGNFRGRVKGLDERVSPNLIGEKEHRQTIVGIYTMHNSYSLY